ncbi:hypothetical protein Bca101_060892 [Brassica carinata]
MAVSQSSSSVTSHPFDGPPCHCSRRTLLVMALTDANPGRRFYKCYLHGFFTWADREEPHGWQKQSLLEARDQIRRLREDKKSLYNEIAELEKQLALQATAERAQRPEDEEIDGQGMPNLVYSDREKVMRQLFILSWGGFISTTAIIIYMLSSRSNIPVVSRLKSLFYGVYVCDVMYQFLLWCLIMFAMVCIKFLYVLILCC